MNDPEIQSVTKTIMGRIERNMSKSSAAKNGKEVACLKLTASLHLKNGWLEDFLRLPFGAR